MPMGTKDATCILLFAANSRQGQDFIICGDALLHNARNTEFCQRLVQTGHKIGAAIMAINRCRGSHATGSQTPGFFHWKWWLTASQVGNESVCRSNIHMFVSLTLTEFGRANKSTSHVIAHSASQFERSKRSARM
jgi:hypothetical protein